MENEIITQENQRLQVSQSTPMRLVELAVNQGADIEKLERLMALSERYDANQAKKAFDLAMSEFQSILPVIEKGGVVDFESSKGRTYYTYAKIEDIAEAIKPALKKTGLSYRFTQSQNVELITVRCIVTHKDGHSEFSELTSGRDSSGGKDALKGIASTLSYLRRYTLTGLMGIVVGGEDFDSEDGTGFDINQETQCYPDTEFNKNFPAWSKVIQVGKKTPDQMLTYLQKKGIVISQAQFEQLKQVEVK